MKFAVLLSSYGWGGGAVRQIQEMLEQLKIEIIGALEINGPPMEDDMMQIIKIGKTLAKKVKEET
jgi:flavorubredoxin